MSVKSRDVRKHLILSTGNIQLYLTKGWGFFPVKNCPKSLETSFKLFFNTFGCGKKKQTKQTFYSCITKTSLQTCIWDIL